MFELKLILEKYEKLRKVPLFSEEIISQEISAQLKEDSEKSETLYGDVRMFRTKTENVSLTEKQEFFRFLPINRANVIFIIALPPNMTTQDFSQFIEKHLKNIDYIRFIYKLNQENTDPIFQAILYFCDQNSADNFYYEFNSKNYQTNKFEYMYIAFISKLTFFLKGDEKINLFLFDFEKSELSTCPLCLEKMDVTTSGIHTILNMVKVVNKERWINYKKSCKVCKCLSEKESAKCENENCEKTTNIWCCLVCGYLGCDRYQNCHAVKHFETTFHRYSIDLATERIWDYLGDNYVHRFISLTKNEETISSINFEFSQDEQSNPIDSKEFLTRIENIIYEYNFVLSSQLEEQRKYYEKEIDKIEQLNDVKFKQKFALVEKLKKEISDNKKNSEENKKIVKESKKKITNIQKKIKSLKEQNELTDELTKNVKQDIEKLEKSYGENNDGELEIKIRSKLILREEKKKKLAELYQKITENY